ncbi:unnamed protein product, partial [Polarella glacialis]
VMVRADDLQTAYADNDQGGHKSHFPESDGRPTPESKDLRVVMLGVPLHRLFPDQGMQFLVLAATVLSASVTCAALQERVLYVPGFKYTGWMALVTSLGYVACAYCEKHVSGDTRRIGTLVDYVKLSLMTMGGMYLTNFSLHYLSYPLRVVFKSSKLIPVMALSVIYLKKRYTLI